MSQTPTTPDTKVIISENSKRGPGRPPKTSAPTDLTPTIDLEAVGQISVEKTEEHLRLSAKLMQLETAAIYANQAKIDWLEVEEDILKHFCNGNIPEAGYFIYKNVKLCLKDTAQSLAKRDNLSCHEILFPKESYMKVGVKRA